MSARSFASGPSALPQAARGTSARPRKNRHVTASPPQRSSAPDSCRSTSTGGRSRRPSPALPCTCGRGVPEPAQRAPSRTHGCNRPVSSRQAEHRTRALRQPPDGSRPPDPHTKASSRRRRGACRADRGQRLTRSCTRASRPPAGAAQPRRPTAHAQAVHAAGKAS